MRKKGNKSHVAKLSFTLMVMLALLISPLTVVAQEMPNEPVELSAESVEHFLNSFFEAEEITPHYVGASVVVVKEGEVLALKGYGYADEENGIAVDAQESVFRMASVSKTFNAVAAMQLIEQGDLELHEDITQYLNGLEYENPYDQPVTVEHLLLHTTGFEIQDPQLEDFTTDFDRNVSIEEYVEKNMPAVIREPGSSYMYDNFASLLLGFIVQNVSGQPYEEYMEEHVFAPLEMDSSDFLLEGNIVERLVQGYDAVGQPVDLYNVTPNVMPHGGMLSTAEDIGKFMISFLNSYKGDEEGIISAETARQMSEYQSALHPLMPDTTYGFEAAMQIPGAGSNEGIITKAGDLLDGSTYMFLLPEHEAGVFISYNQPGALRNLFYPQFISTFFPEYVLQPDFQHYDQDPAEELERFAGYYADLRLSSVVHAIRYDDDLGSLTISDAYFGMRPLQQLDSELFLDTLTYQFITFKAEDDGTISYLNEGLLNPMGYAQRGEEAEGFVDVNEEDAYAPYIFALQSLGYYPNESDENFNPEQYVTRAEFIESVLTASSLEGSETMPQAFVDIEEHPSAKYIQLAYEMGMAAGTGADRFEPNREITREEAAAMLGRIYEMQYPIELFSDIPLTGDINAWAFQSVQMMVALQIHGPEVIVGEEGADYLAAQYLTRQEEAAMLYALFTVPTDQIVVELAAQQGEELEDVMPEEIPPFLQEAM